MEPNIEQIEKDVEGMIGLTEAKVLYKYASEAKEGCIVEIGTGKSTIFLGLGSKYGHNLPIYAIDIWRCCATPVKEQEATIAFIGDLTPIYDESFLGKPSEEFLELIKRYKLEDIVIPVINYSEKAFEEWKPQREKISFLFIDNDHRYYFVKKDIETWGHSVVVGGYIYFHDEAYIGVHTAIAEMLKSGLFERVHDSVFRRVR